MLSAPVVRYRRGLYDQTGCNQFGDVPEVGVNGQTGSPGKRQPFPEAAPVGDTRQSSQRSP